MRTLLHQLDVLMELARTCHSQGLTGAWAGRIVLAALTLRLNVDILC